MKHGVQAGEPMNGWGAIKMRKVNTCLSLCSLPVQSAGADAQSAGVAPALQVITLFILPQLPPNSLISLMSLVVLLSWMLNE